MTPIQLNSLILPPALSLLGPRYDTPAARAMMIAIAIQESRLQARVQVGGPARSYWQFELGGITGIVTHKASRDALKAVCDALNYEFTAAAIFTAIKDNDILAAACARLLLFTSPKALPDKSDIMGAWRLYSEELWKPGTPRFSTWAANWAKAWEVVEAVNGA